MTKAHNALSEVVLLEDEPVRDHRTDELNVISFSRVVAGAAKGTNGPFTIGIYGDWGFGKTSVLKQARSMLDEDGDSPIVTVLFNAWQYEHDDCPLIPLVATIVQAVETKVEKWKSSETKIKEKSLSAFTKITAALRAIAYGVSLKAKIGVPGVAEFEGAVVVKDIIEREAKLLAPRDPRLGSSLYYNAFEALDAAAGSHNSDAKADAPDHKIVVFIDDLDRCLPPQALKLLENIKLVLAQRGFVFVLAIDPRIVQGYLTHRYREEFHVADYDVGPSYLDKIVQLALPLPPHEDNFEAYIHELLNRRALMHPDNAPVKEAVRQLAKVLAIGSDHNPRALVRFINNLIVDRALWAQRGKKEAGPQLLGLCVVARILRQHLGTSNYVFLSRSKKACQAILDNKPLPEPKTGEAPSRDDTKMRDLAKALDNHGFLMDLVETEQGKLWLSDREQRRKIDGFLEEREQSDAVLSATEQSKRWPVTSDFFYDTVVNGNPYKINFSPSWQKALWARGWLEGSDAYELIASLIAWIESDPERAKKRGRGRIEQAEFMFIPESTGCTVAQFIALKHKA